MNKFAALAFFVLIFNTTIGQIISPQKDTLKNWENYKSLASISDQIMSELKAKDYKAIIKVKRKLGENQDKDEIKSLVDKVNLKIGKSGMPLQQDIIAIMEKYKLSINSQNIELWSLDLIYIFKDPCESKKSDKMIFTFTLGDSPTINAGSKLQSFYYLSCKPTVIEMFEGEMNNDKK